MRHYHWGKRDFQDIVHEEEWYKPAGQSDSARQVVVQNSLWTAHMFPSALQVLS